MSRSANYKNKGFGYTIVQHSAWGYRGDPGFKQGLETREITSRSEKNIVERVGGMVFEDYSKAEDTALELSYPPANTGLYPTFQGSFSNKKIDGLAIAIPLRQVVA